MEQRNKCNSISYIYDVDLEGSLLRTWRRRTTRWSPPPAPSPPSPSPGLGPACGLESAAGWSTCRTQCGQRLAAQFHSVGGATKSAVHPSIRVNPCCTKAFSDVTEWESNRVTDNLTWDSFSPASSVPEGGLGSDLRQVCERLLADVDAFSLSPNLYNLTRKEILYQLCLYQIKSDIVSR